MKLVKRFFPILAATLLFGAACNNDSTSPNGSIQGNWSLHTLNGQQLPSAASDGNGGIAGIVSGELRTLDTNGNYFSQVTFTDGTSVTESGVYSISGNQVTFFDESDSPNVTYQGSISGNVMTVNDGVNIWVYQKS